MPVAKASLGNGHLALQGLAVQISGILVAPDQVGPRH